MSKLYIVPTPIGNIGDITFRAIKILEEVDFILCEDTRTTKKLFSFLKIDIDYKKLFSLNKFNEASKLEVILKNIKNNYTYALVSDAGTPTISDPGQRLVSYLRNNKVKIIPLPGANSIIVALSAIGLWYNSFAFVGFLEKKESRLLKQIENINVDIVIAFESPHRINKTLEIIKNNYGDIKLTIARELTKKFEEIKYEEISNLIKNPILGEIVIIIETKYLKKEK